MPRCAVFVTAGFFPVAAGARRRRCGLFDGNVTTSKLVSTRADMNLRIYSPEELLELRERWGMPMMRRTCRRLRLLYRLHEPRQRVFRIAVKHACDRLEKQRVL